MKHFVLSALLAAALAAPSAATAQVDRPADPFARAGRVMVPRGGALGFVLGHRVELGLSAEQVTRLEAISTALQDRNRPLMEQLRAARPAEGRRPRDLPPEQRRALRDSLQKHRPLVRQLRDKQREAIRQAQEVLTAEQREKARELMRAQRERLRGEPGGRRGPGSPRGR